MRATGAVKTCLGALLLLAACATPQAPSASVVTPFAAHQEYAFHVGTCQAVRESRLGTLGPTVFQPISGDEAFNECVSRARDAFEVQLSEGPRAWR
jgi:hypothetical protein